MFWDQLSSLRQLCPEQKFYRTNCIIRLNESTKGFRNKNNTKKKQTTIIQGFDESCKEHKMEERVHPELKFVTTVATVGRVKFLSAV